MSRINVEDSLANDPRFQAIVFKIGLKLAYGEWVLIAKLAQRYWKEEKLIPKNIYKLGEYDASFIDSGLVQEKENGYYLAGSEEYFAWILAKVKNGQKGGRPSKNNNLKKATNNLNESYKNPPTPTPTPTPTLLKNINSPVDTGRNEKIDINKIFREEIIDYLNQKTNRKYRASSLKAKRHINARIQEGYCIDDFKSVIDKKVAQWLHDPKMNDYLRPQTLFGTNFDDYLNSNNSNFKSLEEIIDNFILYLGNPYSEYKEKINDYLWVLNYISYRELGRMHENKARNEIKSIILKGNSNGKS